MPRKTIARITPSLSGVEMVTETVNKTDGAQFQNNGSQILLVDNGGESSIAVTISMAADKYGRTGSKVVTIPEAEQRFIGPFQTEPFNQEGFVQVDFSDDEDVLVGVLSLQS